MPHWQHARVQCSWTRRHTPAMLPSCTTAPLPPLQRRPLSRSESLAMTMTPLPHVAPWDLVGSHSPTYQSSPWRCSPSSASSCTMPSPSAASSISVRRPNGRLGAPPRHPPQRDRTARDTRANVGGVSSASSLLARRPPYECSPPRPPMSVRLRSHLPPFASMDSPSFAFACAHPHIGLHFHLASLLLPRQATAG